jgi:hypothetical protein
VEKTRGVIGLVLIVAGIVFVLVWMGVVLATFGVGCFLVGSQMVRLYLRRPAPENLVRVVRANAGQSWMDVRFGNPDYARLVDDLNTSNSDQ